TERAAELGDRSWRELLERHHLLVRRELARYRGEEKDTAGDGFFATFDGPARAIRCAQAVVEGVRGLGLELRAGVHTGECERNELDPAEVEDVQVGCVSQVGEQGWNIGRMAPLVAGWPESVAGTTVDRQCGSSMQTNFNAAAAVWSGQLDLVVSAGVESMSRVPMGSSGGDLSEKLLERFEIVPQGISAELIADEWGFSRKELDAYSLESHRRALA